MARYRSRHRRRSSEKRALPAPRLRTKIEFDISRQAKELADLRRLLVGALEEAERRTGEVRPLAERYQAITSNPASYKRRLPLFELLITREARAELNSIEAEQAEIWGRPYIVTLVEGGPIHDVMRRLQGKIVQAERALKEFGYELDRRQKADEADARTAQREAAESRRKERAAEITALADRAKGSIRESAAQLRNKLRRDHPCPYCGGVLGETPHADHIHPVKKGGLSTPANMVYVCAACNGAKRDYTLNQYIDRNGLNRDLIYLRLRGLGKDY